MNCWPFPQALEIDPRTGQIIRVINDRTSETLEAKFNKAFEKVGPAPF